MLLVATAMDSLCSAVVFSPLNLLAPRLRKILMLATIRHVCVRVCAVIVSFRHIVSRTQNNAFPYYLCVCVLAR